MSNVGSLEYHGLGSKFVQIGRVNFLAPVAGNRIGSLLIRQKDDQIGLALGFLCHSERSLPLLRDQYYLIRCDSQRTLRDLSTSVEITEVDPSLAR